MYVQEQKFYTSKGLILVWLFTKLKSYRYHMAKGKHWQEAKLARNHEFAKV